MRALRCVALLLMGMLLSGGLSRPVLAQDAANSPADHPGVEQYLEGIDALQSGDYPAAVKSFSAALELDEENPDYYTARGVARTLAEQFPKAIKDFDRSLRLRDGDYETKLWLSAAYFMSDQSEKGSAIFSYGPREMYDYAETVSEMSRIYMTSRYRGSYYDNATHSDVETHEAVKTGFPRAAAAFASRRKASGGAVSGTALERAKKLFDQGDFARAFADLDLVLQTSPDDFDVLSYHGRAALELGDAVMARRELTRALTLRPDWADGYAARARAAATMGDVHRAQKDAQIASRLGAQMTPISVPPAGDPSEALKRLVEATSDDSTSQQWIDLAIEVVRGTEARRVRYDEAYQDRLRELTEATRTIPASADSFAALGQFLYAQAATVRGEKVEPRAEFTSYRVLTDASQDAEITAAEQACDAALKIDGNHVGALAYKAACQMWRLKWADAENTLRRALANQSNDPRVLSMMARVLDHAAQMHAAEASRLRTTDTWEDMNYIYWRYPSSAELAQADQYETQARQLWDLAIQHLTAAAQTTRGTVEGLYFQGMLDLREGNAEAARDAFEQAVKLKADFVEAHEQLASLYADLRQTEKAIDEQSLIANLFHTTAGPMLRLAWMQVPRTAWKSAKAAIAKAQAIDPADPRCEAYLGRIAQGQENDELAIAHFRAALALLEARDRLRGWDKPASSGTPGTIDSPAAALELAVRMHLGQALSDDQQWDEALKVHLANLDMQPRITEDALTLPAPTAMLPDPELPASEFPVAQPPAYFLAWSHVGAGEALMKLKKSADAEQHFNAAQKMENAWPMTRDGRNQLMKSSAWARLHLCEMLADRGDFEQAFMLMNNGGWPWDLPEDVQKKIDKLRDRITKGYQRSYDR